MPGNLTRARERAGLRKLGELIDERCRTAVTTRDGLVEALRDIRGSACRGVYVTIDAVACCNKIADLARAALKTVEESGDG